jgi:hypothetical protein
MNQVHTVASDKVYQVWDEVKDYLKASIETNTGDCTLEQVVVT